MEAQQETFVRNEKCPVCKIGDAAAKADTRGRSSYINAPGYVDEFPLDGGRRKGWRLMLTCHGRFDQTDVSVFELDLAGTSPVDPPDFAEISRMLKPEWFGQDPNFRTLRGVTVNSFQGEVDESAISPILLPGHFLVFADERGEHPHTPCKVPLMHINVNFTSFE
jgi:hypothetical protein